MVQHDQGIAQLRMMMKGLCVVLLLLHFYYFCYGCFAAMHWTFPIADRIVGNFQHSGFLRHPYATKAGAILFWIFSLFIGSNDNPLYRQSKKTVVICLVAGVIFYFGSSMLVDGDAYSNGRAAVYLVVSVAGFTLAVFGAGYFASSIVIKFSQNIFNEENESFPQEERLIENDYSVNLPARYRFRNRYRNSYINNINVFRGTAVWGSAGSGKTYFIIRHYITQLIEKKFTLFVFDFKFDDLTRIAYNALLKFENNYPVKRAFYVIDFDHLDQSNRCNPLDPASMNDLSDAAESSRTILLALNREWIVQQGNFWVESAISFITANIWFLRKFQDGKYCTLPHLIELIQYDYAKLFSVLRSYPEIETLIGTFVSAFLNDTMDMLESQAASARIALASLSSPPLYYVLSGNEFTLDVNNPAAPKIVCMGSNPQKQQTYGAVLSLYITRMIKLVNKKGQLPCGIVLDELSTIYFPGLSNLLATARSNKVAVVYGAQSLSLIRATYGRDQADVLFDLPGNAFFGQSNHETARAASESLGKILQPKQSYSTNSRDNTVSRSEHLDLAVPPSKITSLSSGEFVGFVSDNPDQKIKLKGFHCEIINDHEAIRQEEAGYKELPRTRSLAKQAVEDNFLAIKEDVRKMINFQLSVMQANPLLSSKIIAKGDDSKKLKRRP